MTPTDDREDHKGHWLGKERLETHVPERGWQYGGRRRAALGLSGSMGDLHLPRQQCPLDTLLFERRRRQEHSAGCCQGLYGDLMQLEKVPVQVSNLFHPCNPITPYRVRS